MSAHEQGYSNLIGYLQQTTPVLPIETLHAAISYYLVHVPQHLTPTQLTAAVIASPLWHPITLTVLVNLASVFRQSTHMKYKLLQARSPSLFSSKERDYNVWLTGVLKGLGNGDTLLRFAISGGILLALDNSIPTTYHQRKAIIEEEVITSLAALLESQPSGIDSEESWERDFQHSFRDLDGRYRLAVLLASQYLPSLSEKVLIALRPSLLVSACISMIQVTFISGHFLNNSDSSADFATQIHKVSTSDEFRYIGALSKLLSRVVECSPNWTSRQRHLEIKSILHKIANALQRCSENIERDWRKNRSFDLNEDDIQEPSRRDTAIEMWNILKTYLFVVVMSFESVLSIVVYESVLSPHSNLSLLKSNSLMDFTSEISISYLTTLAHLAPLVSKFGGVAVSGANGNGDVGFKEMKRSFYMALDVLSKDATMCDNFIKQLIDVGANQDLSIGQSFWRAKKVYSLACIEQLVPVLNLKTLEECVLPICQPYLMDTQYRDIYESAHSVMLSIFAAQSMFDRPLQNTGHTREEMEVNASKTWFARKLVPGYIKCLIQNAEEGMLSTSQFCLAYSSVVGSVSASSRRMGVYSERNAESSLDIALVDLCINSLVEAIGESNEEYSVLERGTDDTVEGRYLKLKMAMVSLVPGVSQAALPRILDTAKDLIESEKDAERKMTLLEALHGKILRELGAEEKDYAIRWWHENINHWDISENTNSAG